MTTDLVTLTCGRCGITGQADPDAIPAGTTVTLCPDCNDYADEVMQAPLYLGSGMVDDGAAS